MKAMLVFDRPEDEGDLEAALKAQDLKGVIQDLDEFLRKKMKYEDINTMSVQELRDELWRIVQANCCEGLFE